MESMHVVPPTLDVRLPEGRRLPALPYFDTSRGARHRIADLARTANLPLSHPDRRRFSDAARRVAVSNTVIILVGAVRSKEARWANLRDLVLQLDRLVTANTQIDLLQPGAMYRKLGRAATFEQDIDRLMRRVQREISRLQVDRLQLDLRLKKKRDGRS